MSIQSTISGHSDLPVPHEKAIMRAWIDSLELVNSHQVLFELETRLVAVDRFIRPGELALLGGANSLTGYRSETRTVVRTMSRVQQSIRLLQTEQTTRSEMFGRFVEQSLMADRTRDALLVGRYDQDTPNQSFGLLDHTIQQMIHIGNGLLKASEIPAPVFFSLGEMIKSALYANRFFNPFRTRGFSVLHDKIDQPILVNIVRQIEDQSIRKAAGLILLSCQRLLRYLELVDLDSPDTLSLRDNLPIMALLRSDLDAMAPIFRDRIPKLLQDSTDPQAQRILELSDSLMFQFSMEGKKVFQHVLKEASTLSKRESLLIALETANGILKNFIQQSIVWLAKSFEPELNGTDFFVEFVSRKEQSSALRESVWILRESLKLLQKNITSDPTSELTQQFAIGVHNVTSHFAVESIKQVRATDIETFRALCADIKEACNWDFSIEELSKRALFDLHKHIVYLDTTLQCIEQRNDLIGDALNIDLARERMQDFLSV